MLEDLLTIFWVVAIGIRANISYLSEAGAALHPTGSPAACLPIQPSKISALKRRIISAPFQNLTSEKPTPAGKRTTPGEKPAMKKRKYSTRTTSPPDVQESPPVGVEATKTIAEDPAEEEDEAEEEGTKERALL